MFDMSWECVGSGLGKCAFRDPGINNGMGYNTEEHPI